MSNGGSNEPLVSTEQLDSGEQPLQLGPARGCREQFECLASFLLKKGDGFQRVETVDDGPTLIRVANKATGEYSELIELTEGLLLTSSSFAATGQAVMRGVGDGWVRWGCILSGNYSNSKGFDPETAGTAKIGGFFFLPDGQEANFSVGPSGKAVRSISLWCSRPMFAEFVGPDVSGLQPDVCQILHGTAPAEVYCPVHLSPTMERLVLDILDAPENVVMKRLFLQSKAFSLVYEMIADMRREKSGAQPGLNTRQTASVIKAYELLQEDYVAPPSLEQLARQVGLNRTSLVQAFKLQFGLTIGEYCLELKMQQAWHRLVKTDEAISDIAYSLGYEHTANFSTAVKRCFSLTPREIRQSN